MHFPIATILAVLPLLASATPIAQSPRVTVPLTKRTNVFHRDGSVNIEVLKTQAAAASAYVYISTLLPHCAAFIILLIPDVTANHSLQQNSQRV